MFIGRKKELAFLKELWESHRFEMLILHGRRRVGKSCLLAEFGRAYSGQCVFFTADRGSEASNVRRFVKELALKAHAGSYVEQFTTWEEVFSFIGDFSFPERFLIIIDEFTYLSYGDKAFDSRLQNAIDHIFSKKNIFLILCGSEVSTIEDIINNSARPLYGRKTAELKLFPFGYREAKNFFPGYTNEEALETYMILGGMPLYLSLFDPKISPKQNIIHHILSTTGYLYNEVDTVLRMELTETTLYKAILSAISAKKLNLNDIATKVGEANTKVSKYLSVLRNLSIVQKEVPCGEKENKRNALYYIADNYFAFYFTFIESHKTMLNGLIEPEAFYETELTNESLMNYFGFRFEGVCREYVTDRARSGLLPFYPETLGRWWGNNREKKKQEEIDIVALNKTSALFCECKYKRERFGRAEWQDLLEASECVSREKKYFMAFSKSGFEEEVKEKDGDEALELVDLDSLYS